MTIFTYIMVYYLTYYHVGRRLANEFAEHYSTAKLFGYVALAVFIFLYFIIDSLVKNNNVSIEIIALITGVLTAATLYFHFKSLKE